MSFRSTRKIVAVGVFLTSAAFGQSAPVPVPRTIGYETTEALNRRLREDVLVANTAAGAHARAKVVVVGRSLAGEEILGVEIGRAPEVGPMPNDATGPERRTWGKKPALLVVAGIEGDRLAGSAVLTALVARVLSLPPDEFEKTFAKESLYVVPRLNPDGAARYFGPLRSGDGTNRRVIDQDRDGRTDEDPADDLDGDGLRLSMRVPDVRGTLVPDADNPRKMRAPDAAKGERGKWKLLTEGKDDDGDGEMNEDGDSGVFVEHNFPQGYVENDLSNGVYPTSEPEARALLEYVLARKEIAQVLIYGANENLVDLWAAAKGDDAPQGGARRGNRQAATAVNAEDRELFADAAQAHKEKTKREQKATAPEHGSFALWAYFQFGVPAYEVNLFEVAEDAKADPAKPAESQPASAPAEDAIQAAERAVRNDGFVAWHEVTHPTLGKVEVGGWKPYVRFNPSEAALALIAEREFPFVTELLQRAADVQLNDIQVKTLSSGLYEVTAVVENKGRLPSALVQGVTNGQTGAVIVDLSLPKEKIVQGQKRTFIRRLREKGGFEIERWLIRADPGTTFKIEVAPPQAHAFVKEVSLL